MDSEITRLRAVARAAAKLIDVARSGDVGIYRCIMEDSYEEPADQHGQNLAAAVDAWRNNNSADPSRVQV